MSIHSIIRIKSRIDTNPQPEYELEPELNESFDLSHPAEPAKAKQVVYHKRVFSVGAKDEQSLRAAYPGLYPHMTVEPINRIGINDAVLGHLCIHVDNPIYDAMRLHTAIETEAVKYRATIEQRDKEKWMQAACARDNELSKLRGEIDTFNRAGFCHKFAAVLWSHFTGGKLI